ncbi:MAG: hypothetical protein JNG89_16995 [Planctomycetaceae bacterium]|nr:hypothetical protein [Planctomycetaceae bacterium]
MPEKEFELYLSLLGRLLRLSPEQKTSIERELRDHFEERFEELVRRGVPRDVAIEQTLDEFGDVAGLAGEFTQLSRRGIRRRIMQGTAATAGIAAAVVIWATLFRGPEPAVGPAPNLIAQENAVETPSPEPIPTDESGTPAVPALTTDLIGSIVEGSNVEWIDPGRFMPEWSTKPVDGEFVDTPLTEVLSYFSQMLGVNMMLDNRALSEVGLTGEELITVSVHQTPAYAALNQVFHNVGGTELAWVTADEVIKVTTKEAVDNLLNTRYHNVRDLLDAGYTHEQLANLIAQLTAGPWEKTDGLGGVVSDFGDLLIVRNSERSLAEAECVLAGLRSPSRVRWIGEPEMHARLYAALDEKTDIDLSDASLRDAVAYLSEQHHIPMGIDVAALADEGMTGDETISLVVNGIRLGSALRLMLESGGTPLDILVRDGVMWVTTQEVAQNELDVVIYNVEDITGDDQEQMGRLQRVIADQTEGPWESVDGLGGVMITLRPDSFACSQSARGQDEVAAVLEVVRNSLQQSGGDRKYLTAGPVKLESRFYRMDAETAEDMARLIPELIEAGTWRVPGFNGPSKEEAIAAGQLGSIHQLSAGQMLLKIESGDMIDVPDAEPNKGSEHPENVQAREAAVAAANAQVAVVPQAVLIITHQPAVLNEVSRFLKSLLSGDGGWKTEGAGDKVKFIAPGFQEGQWRGSLGGPGGPSAPAAESPEAAGFGGGGGGGGFFSIAE